MDSVVEMTVSHPAMITHDGSGRDLVARLDRANEEIDRLHMQLDRSGNVVRGSATRYMELLHESAADLNARSRQTKPPMDTYERRKLEGDPRLPGGPHHGDGRRVRLGDRGRAGERPSGDAGRHPAARRGGGGGQEVVATHVSPHGGEHPPDPNAREVEPGLTDEGGR